MLFNSIISRLFKFLFIFIVLSTLFIFVNYTNDVNAKSDASVWSWTTNRPFVFSSNTIKTTDDTSCDVSYQKMTVIGELQSKDVCMMPGEKVKFGTYYNGNKTMRAVSFGYDNKMYQVWNACDQYGGCMYLESSDTLIAKQYAVGWSGKSIMVYKNFTKRLKYSINGLSISYRFDTSNPDYVFRSPDGNLLPIGGFGASDDGKWLAIELVGKAIGVLDIQNLKLRFISTQTFSYGMGFNATSELDISNGGQHVAVMGLNAGLTIYDTPASCGDEATDDRMIGNKPMNNPCATSEINTNDFIKNFFIGYSPRFNYDGGQLSFYTTSYTGEMREVTLRANGYKSQQIDYLALGDSFTSGEGENDGWNYLNGTNSEFEKCHVSSRSYPYLVADLSKINPKFVKNIACSGATTKDIIGEESSYNGQGGRLGKNKLELSDSRKTIAKTEARQSFLPGRILQIEFVNEYSPKIITVGVGGNDVGFMDKLKACLGKDTCSWASNDEDKEQSAIEIKNLFGTLVKTYKKIHAESPTSKILAIGYPKIINEDGKCSLIVRNLLDDSEKKYMNEGVTYINQIISAAARNVGIGYIDIQESFRNKALCDEDPSAMNSTILGDDGALSNDFEWLKVVGQESFHPTPTGHSIIAKSIGNLFDYNYCGNGEVICPVVSPVPEPSSYWIPEDYHDYPIQKNANFISDFGTTKEDLIKQISLENGSFAPNSIVKIEITSTVRSLGSYVASDDGSLSINIDLPNNLEEGYHTLRLYGTSYSGESIELYQVFLYELFDPVSNNVAQNTTKTITPATDPEQKQAVINYKEETINDFYSKDTNRSEVKGASNIATSVARSPKTNASKLTPLIIVVLILFVILLMIISIKYIGGLRNKKIGRIR